MELFVKKAKLMREPTDEQVAAWEAEDAQQSQVLAADVEHHPRPGERTRAGLRAVFALEEQS